MKKLFTFISLMLCACVSYAQEEEQEIVDITAKFTYCWNGAETLTHNDDGTITFNSAAWGGLASWLKDSDYEDLSNYSKIVFEYAEPTTVNTQILLQFQDETNIYAWGNVGITELELAFEDKDMSAVSQVALQTSDATVLTIKRVYLVLKSGDEPEPVDPTVDQVKDILPLLTSTWNTDELVTNQEDGSKVYTSVSWGGLSTGWIGGTDWSKWDALVMEFAEPTTTKTRLAVHPTTAEVEEPTGVTSITCVFGDADMTAVEQAALQTEDPAVITITKAYLIKYGIPAETPSFDSERSLLRFYSSVGEAEEKVQTNYTITFGETSLEPTKIEEPVDALVFLDFTTTVTGGEAAFVEILGWCYPTDREKTEDDMMRFPLTKMEDGTWNYDFNNMDIVPLLNSEKHHDWILECCLVGTDANENEFLLNNGGENYKILFSDNNASSVNKGDVNEDGNVDISDIVAVINQIAGTAKYANADVNEDNNIDISDIVAIINIIAGQ